MRSESAEQPDCFVDLNLDQVIGSILAKHDAEALRPIFFSTYRDEDIIRYRQVVFTDLERSEVFRIFPVFCERMRSVRAALAYADKIFTTHHRHAVALFAMNLYCRAIDSLFRDIEPAVLRSDGLNNLRHYLDSYTSSSQFKTLSADTQSLQDLLLKISYSMLFHDDKVTVRKYAFESDYTVTILDRFAKFRESSLTPSPGSQPIDDFSLNHIEEGILEFVGRLLPGEFGRVEDHIARNVHFIDPIISTFEREIGFFVAYLEFITPLKSAGLPFCYPEVSASNKNISASASFDIALASKLRQENQPVVCNDFYLTEPECLIVVSGPNQGGKTTFARMFGQLHFLAGLGCPVPGTSATLFLPDRIFTHFEREEDITNLRGKLEEELVRLHHSYQQMTSNSIVILNEIFNSTSLEDQIYLSTNILHKILAMDVIGVCVTFIDALSKLSTKTVSMVSTVIPEDPALRTFTIVRRPADGLAYALSLAEKHGVTYARLRDRVRP